VAFWSVRKKSVAKDRRVGFACKPLDLFYGKNMRFICVSLGFTGSFITQEASIGCGIKKNWSRMWRCHENAATSEFYTESRDNSKLKCYLVTSAVSLVASLSVDHFLQLAVLTDKTRYTSTPTNSRREYYRECWTCRVHPRLGSGANGILQYILLIGLSENNKILPTPVFWSTLNSTST